MVVCVVYLLFFLGCFSTFLWLPYLVIRYIDLKKLINRADYEDSRQCMSKIKVSLFALLCSPLISVLIVLICNIFGDGHFVSFFIFLGILCLCTFLSIFSLAPTVKTLSAKLDANEHYR